MSSPVRSSSSGGGANASGGAGSPRSNLSSDTGSSDALGSERRVPADEEEDEGEELITEDLDKDYRAIPELDQYEREALDEREYETMSADQRREAERKMRRRDRARARREGRLPTAMSAADSDEEEGLRPRQRQRLLAELAGGDEEEEEEGVVNLDDYKGPLKEFLSADTTRREVKRRFRYFLSNYKAAGATIYIQKIATMCTQNKQSLEVSYLHLSDSCPILAVWVADEPEMILELFSEEAMAVVLKVFPDYHNITDEIHVRIVELPIIDQLRNLRQIHLNSLVKVEGVVVRRSSVFPQLRRVKFNCLKCGFVLGPFVQNASKELQPNRCPECQSKGPFTINLSETIYRNFQKVVLQESPGSVPAGRVPRQKDVILLHDLIDSVSPGEEVIITGIYRHNYDTALNTKNGFPVFTTVLHANSVQKKDDPHAALAALTDADERAIRKLAARPNVADLLIRAIAPSVFGHTTVKTALALSMFGGEPKELSSGYRIRGDINVLVLGDPGVAKSQFLKYVQKTAPRAVYTTGKGASAVGLTASVHLDPLTREWTLEGGALVLADRGVCLIDEFDKMNDQDRTSIHEAMEQQSISISKAGIIATLQARCAVIAAANPVKGRYDAQAPLAENVELTDAILSRFDMLCVVRDVVDRDSDTALAQFVLDSHARSHPELEDSPAAPAAAAAAAAAPGAAPAAGAGAAPAAAAAAVPVGADGKPESKDVTMTAAKESADGEPISQELLRKYLMFARTKCHPRIQNVDDDRICKLYAELRRESAAIRGGIPVAPRHVESIIRMAEAHAKMHLREYVSDDDVNVAIKMMLTSFIDSQIYKVQTALRKQFERYLIYKEDHYQLLLHLLHALVKEARLFRLARSRPGAPPSAEPIEIPVEDLEARAESMQISAVDSFLASALFAQNGFEYDSVRKVIRKTD